MPDKPAGGLDKTPLHPSSSPTYTLKITFHRATNLPIADIGKRSSDPYISAQINSHLPTRHPNDPPVRFRTRTIHRRQAPEWNASWTVAGVPGAGIELKARLYDEDPGDHDDRLGKVEIQTGRIDENWAGIKEQEYKVKKTGASLRAYGFRSCTSLIHKHAMHATLFISIEVLGKTKEEVGKVYTLNNFWFVHYSPMIGKLTGTKTEDDNGVERSK
jgi:Ca2+-dependent lipid-binding protein